MSRIPFTGLLLSLSLLLAASGSLQADDSGPQISSGARPLTQEEGVRQWSGSVDDLELQKLDVGFVASGKQWIQLWNAWRFADERPDVDFTKKLAIVSTTRGGRITLDTMLDDEGHLHVSGMETSDLSPGFRYAIQIVDREGVKTVRGKAVPPVREMVQQPVRPLHSGARPLTQEEGVRQWSGSVDDLELQKLDVGFVASGKQWIQLWNAWRFAEERPDVDFTKKLAIVSTTRGGRITLDTVLDEQGHLHVSGMETRDLRPGFRYAIQIVDREGVKTVRGKAVPPVREMVQQPVRPSPRTSSGKPRRPAVHKGPVRINVSFGTQAEEGRRNGVVDAPEDVWNLIDYAQPELKAVKLADGTASDVKITISDNDGEWGIEGPAGAYHAYIYHNCRCVDLTAKFEYLPPGIYDLYVFAHGDAPDQNAAIEVESAGVVTTGKGTLNDGTWDFRSRKLEEGNQYVKYTVEVTEGHPLVVTSRRDGSVYAMLNAIQLERVLVRE